MNDQWFATVLYQAQFMLKEFSPIKTGNLRFNAIRMANVSPGVWEIYIDLEIAPYAPYTNEEWTHKRWMGKRNPNQGWWENGVEKIVAFIAQMLGAINVEVIING